MTTSSLDAAPLAGPPIWGLLDDDLQDAGSPFGPLQIAADPEERLSDAAQHVPS